MKIDDIAKQLANKVNQEHYIKHYLEKVQRGAYNKGIKDAESKQLNLCGVSNRRELLIATFKDLDLEYIQGFDDEEWLANKVIEVINCCQQITNKNSCIKL